MREENPVTGFVSAAWAGFAPALFAAFLISGGVFPSGACFILALALAACAYAAASRCLSPRGYFLACAAACAETAASAVCRHCLSGVARVPAGACVVELQADAASPAYSAAFVVMAAIYMVVSVRQQHAVKTGSDLFSHVKNNSDPVFSPKRNSGADVTFEELERLLKE